MAIYGKVWNGRFQHHIFQDDGLFLSESVPPLKLRSCPSSWLRREETLVLSYDMTFSFGSAIPPVTNRIGSVWASLVVTHTSVSQDSICQRAVKLRAKVIEIQLYYWIVLDCFSS